MTALSRVFPTAYLVPSGIREQLGLHNGLAEQRTSVYSSPLDYKHGHEKIMKMLLFCVVGEQ